MSMKNGLTHACAFVYCLLVSADAVAGNQYLSLTIDNDLFVGNDSGYSNGFYVSAFDTSLQGDLPEKGFLLKPIAWSLPKGTPDGAVSSLTFGQAMNTPQDITIEDPGDDNLPYSALLFVNSAFLHITPTVADRIDTTLGIVGPVALGEPAQKFVHSLTGSDEPQGWDTQLDNELVFQFSRGRTWRSWSSPSDGIDFLTQAEFSLGTIRSGVKTGFLFRYGKSLAGTYATTLLSTNRISNPVAINDSWYVYAGANVGYLFNQIFTDGNTFKDSRSVDYDRENLGVSVGFAYSRNDFSVTFAINDSNVMQDGATADTLKNLTRFGSLTFAWRR